MATFVLRSLYSLLAKPGADWQSETWQVQRTAGSSFSDGPETVVVAIKTRYITRLEDPEWERSGSSFAYGRQQSAPILSYFVTFLTDPLHFSKYVESQAAWRLS